MVILKVLKHRQPFRVLRVFERVVVLRRGLSLAMALLALGILAVIIAVALIYLETSGGGGVNIKGLYPGWMYRLESYMYHSLGLM